jgi:hypothetical protein
MLITINRLAELTGIHRDTIRKRCSELIPEGVRGAEVESTQALAMIYGVENDYDYDTEKARLTHHQANIAGLEEEIKRKNLIPADAVQTHWESMIGNMRGKLLNLPGRLASKVVGTDTLQDAEREAMLLVREALEEVAKSGVP